MHYGINAASVWFMATQHFQYSFSVPSRLLFPFIGNVLWFGVSFRTSHSHFVEDNSHCLAILISSTDWSLRIVTDLEPLSKILDGQAQCLCRLVHWGNVDNIPILPFPVLISRRPSRLLLLRTSSPRRQSSIFRSSDARPINMSLVLSSPPFFPPGFFPFFPSLCPPFYFFGVCVALSANIQPPRFHPFFRSSPLLLLVDDLPL